MPLPLRCTLHRTIAACTLVFALVAPASPAAATPVPEDDSTLVATPDGRVEGRLTVDHRIFEGIPYAQPPVGDLRLRAPRPAESWAGVLGSTSRRSPCAQTFTWPVGTPPQFRGSEDCLYLNLHVPRTPGPKPVLVFFHGGGFANGDGGAYDPQRISRAGDVIVVTVSYRLGALGFLRHPALGDRAAGNFGIADQQAALRWVQRSISAFGGDAGNVTVWGESAGAYSVCAHLSSPSARGLFDKAIVQSGPCDNDFVPRREANDRGIEAAREMGCARTRSVARCLREVPVETIAGLYTDRIGYGRIANDLPWFPVAGTPLLPLQPADAVRAGLGPRVPLLLGGTRDEMRALIVEQYDGIGNPITEDAYSGIVADLYGPDAPSVLAEYPPARFGSPSLALATALTDEGRFQGTCPQLRYAHAARRHSPVHLYEFAEPSGGSSDGFPHGAAHGEDVKYFFDSYDRDKPPTTPAQDALAARMIEDWTTFARTGQPGSDWPTARNLAHSYTTGGEPIVDLAAAHRCGLWDSLRTRTADQ